MGLKKGVRVHLIQRKLNRVGRINCTTVIGDNEFSVIVESSPLKLFESFSHYRISYNLCEAHIVCIRRYNFNNYKRTSTRVSGSCYLPNSCLIHNTRRKNTSRRNIQRDAIVSRRAFVQRHETQRERARRFIDQTDENLTKEAENPMCVFNERDNKT